MTSPFKDGAVWAWLLGGALALVAILYLLGCGSSSGKRPPPDLPKLMSCAERVVQIITDTPSCADIPIRLNELLAAQAECFQALTGEQAPVWTCGDGGK